MISVEEAKEIIKQNSTGFSIVITDLDKAYGKVIASDIHSTINTPPFDQSAMDGYAFSYEKWDKISLLEVVGEVQAGSFFTEEIQINQAVRIFTGAAVPKGLDTVIAQEKVSRVNTTITIEELDIAKGRNVRPTGSQTQIGAVVLQKGHLLTPAAISLLAGVGIDRVPIFDNPKISILVTGKELVKPGDEIAEGQIFESNSFALSAVLHQMGIEPISIEMVDDSLSETEEAIKDKLDSDILIITGGVSVGDYDFVAQALTNCGVQQLYHKIKQKPGKPFYFGKHNNTLVFALPGNPAAVLTCFYEYVSEAIGIFTRKEYFEDRTCLLENSYIKKAGLTHFVKGNHVRGKVTILEGQESYLVNSFAYANCLVQLPEEKETFKKGDFVRVLQI